MSSQAPTRTRPEQPAVDDAGWGTAAVVWSLVLASSSLPQIVFTESAGRDAPVWLALVQAALLIGVLRAGARSEAASRLSGTVLWLLAMVLGWNLVISGATGTETWDNWQHDVPWVARGAVVQLLLFVPTLLLVLFGPGRLGRHQLRLVVGDDHRTAGRGIYTAGTSPRWRRLGLTWAVLITIGTLTAMTFALGSKADDLDALAWSLPAIAILAATNTVNEEFGYRNVPLAVLPGLVGHRHAMLATGLLFGLAHYYGNPPGASGVLLATFLGVFIAKSMVETGGSKWAWIVHWLQDMVIFSFLTAAWWAL
jgi:membrane protease YdiL (CAAX protease family)